MRRSLVIVAAIALLLSGCFGRSSRRADEVADQPPPAPMVKKVSETIRSGSDETSAEAGSNFGTITPPAPAVISLPSPTPAVPPMPLPTPPSPMVDYYVVQAGDTLGGISFAYDISLEELVTLNDLESEAAIIQVGQTLRVPLDISRSGPLVTLLPDSEVVYSPAYVDFDVTAFLQEQGGYLADYSQRVNGQVRTGAEVVTLVAEKFAVGPRILLAMYEFYTGGVTNETLSATAVGAANPYGENVFLQLGWLANRINEGYYGYKRSGSIPVVFRDRSRALVPPGMNAGTVGLQNALAVNTIWETWLDQVRPEGFMQTYRRLFGDPFAYAIEPLIPITLTQPEMALPWRSGVTFYYTGGPHPAYGDGSAWAAVDFGPPDVLGSCYYSAEPLTAAADGRVILANTGELYLDLDGDGDLRTGWVLLYLHVVADDGLVDGQQVAAGMPLGYASCEGGLANASHLHLARRYNGEWLAADGPVPLILSGWRFQNGLGQYEGGMVRDGITKTACECWDEEGNAVVAD